MKMTCAFRLDGLFMDVEISCVQRSGDLGGALGLHFNSTAFLSSSA